MHSLPSRSLRSTLFLLAAGLFATCSGRGQQPAISSVAVTERIEKSPILHLHETSIPFHAPFSGWELGAVSGVAVGADGLFYVVQRGDKADPILVFDRQGKLLRSWGKDDFRLPHSLRLDPFGNVWALDAGDSKIIEYTSSGNKILTIAIQPVPETGSPFRGVTDLSFAPNGHVFVTDGYGNARVLEYTADGVLLRTWGRSGSGQGEFHLPHSIQISPSHVVYVADRENGRIEKFNLEGKFLGQICGLGRCYALALRGGALWATMGPMDHDPGASGWLVRNDPESGHILGHMSLPKQRAGHALDLTSSGEPVTTVGSGVILFRRNSHY